MENTIKINLENLKGASYMDKCHLALAINNEISSYELDMLVDLLDEKEDSDNFLKNTIALNFNTSAETLDKLLKINSSYEIPLSIANHRNASAEILNILSTYTKTEYIDGGTCSMIRHCVAKNKNTSAETLDKLSKDEDAMVREYVAKNENTSAETLDRLSKDENSTVRYCVTINKNTSAEILDELSKDENSMIREYVARNKNTSAETLGKLSKDENPIIRFCVAKNKNTSAVTLYKLSKDENLMIRYCVYIA